MTTHLMKYKLYGLFSVMALGLGLLLPSTLAFGTETASATFTDSLVSPGVWQYNLNLTDTGTTTVGTFWFAWKPGDNFMAAVPTDITNPAGWSSVITSGGPSSGNAIQWRAGAGDDLAAGDSLGGFSFESTLSPAQLAAHAIGSPGFAVDSAVIYSRAPFSDAGFDLQATPASATAPEPADLSLCGLGLALIGLGILSRRQ